MEDITGERMNPNTEKDRNVQEAAESLSLLLKGDRNKVFLNK